MAMTPLIKIDKLLTPIKGDNPSGEDLRFQGTKGPFAAIKEASREDDGKRAYGETTPKNADWAAVIKLASDALAKQTKDLEIAGWLVLGAVHCYGFPGLRDGLTLLTQLHEQYWDTVHPIIEDGELDLRSGPLEGLTRKLVRAVRALPLVEVAGQPGLAFGDSTKAEFEEAVLTLSLETVESLVSDVNDCQQQLEKLETIVDKRFLDAAKVLNIQETFDPPSLLSLREIVEDCSRILNGIIQTKGGSVIPQEGQNGNATQSDRNTQAGKADIFDVSTPTESYRPKNREEAIQQLLGVAEYFRRNEPLSPIASLVQRAARWGQLSFDQWLEEMIKKDFVLREVKDVLGLREGENNEATPDQINPEKPLSEDMIPNNRAVALSYLTETGNYFRIVEPQGPIAYLLNRAVKWGKMSLEEWLQEVVRDGEQLRDVRTMLGMPEINNG